MLAHRLREQLSMCAGDLWYACVDSFYRSAQNVLSVASRVQEKKGKPPTSRSQSRQQSGVTARSSSERSGDKDKEVNPANTPPAAPSHRSGEGSTARSAASATQAGSQTSTRSAATAASLSSSRDARGPHGGSDSGRGPLSARTTSRSHASSAVSPTDYTTDTPR